MQTWEAITSRRNVRSFADRPIPAADLDQILEAGRRSPSSQNWQPWDFILVTDRAKLRDLAQVWRAARPPGGSAGGHLGIRPAPPPEVHPAPFDPRPAPLAGVVGAAGPGLGSRPARG